MANDDAPSPRLLRPGLGVADDGRIVAKRARARFGKLSPEEQRRFQESAYKANQ